MSSSWPPRFASTDEADDWMRKTAIADAALEARGPAWQAENGETVQYSTERLSSGKFAVVVWQKNWGGVRWAYVREFRLRKDAKARAIELYAERSPRWRKRLETGRRRPQDRIVDL